MPELLGGVCLFAFGVFVFALVGHGIWVAGAAIFRAMFGASEPARAAPASLEAIVNHVRRLREQGTIDADGCERLLTAVRTEQESLPQRIAPSGAPTLASSPATPLARPGVAYGPDAPHALPAANEGAPPVRVVVEADVVGEASAASATSGPTESAEPREAASPVARVRQYAARRAQAEEQEGSVTTAVVQPPKSPSRPFSQLLAAFMEERNIRWGELVGGLLIVGGSIALVLSFWAQIADRPLLQFFVFNGVTAGLFGMGVYAERRMKLPMTSHGLLIIATLLVPLNFLALAAFSRTAAPLNFWMVAGEVVSLGLFSYLTYVAGQTLQPGKSLGVAKAWHLVLGVIGPCVAALLVRRFVAHDAETPLLMFYALGLLPLVCYVVATAGMIWPGQRAAEVDEPAAYEMFRWLGITSFAAVPPLALLIAKPGEIAHARETLGRLSPLVSLCAGPSLAVGLLLWRRVRGAQLAGVRTIGTTIAVFGTLVLISGIVLAWPNPAQMLPTSAVAFAVLTAVAILFEIPAAHLVAAACLVLAYLIGFHVATGHAGWSNQQPSDMARKVVSAASGVALTPMPVLLGLAAGLWLRRGRRLDGLFYGVVAAASAVVSIGLVTWHGFMQVGDPVGATWVYAIYAIAALAAALWLRNSSAAIGGAVLLLAALVQGIAYQYAGPWELRQPWLLAMLCHASVMTVMAVVARWLPSEEDASLDQHPSGMSRALKTTDGTFAVVALATSLVATALLAWSVPHEPAGFVATHALWIALCWLILALLAGSAALFTAFQAALTVSVVFGVVAGVQRQPWAVSRRLAWLDPWSLQAQGIALAMLSLVWTLARLAVARFSKPSINVTAGSARQVDQMAGLEIRPTTLRVRGAAAQLLSPAWPSCDRVVAYLGLMLLVVLSIYAAWPGTAQELAPRNLAAELERISPQAATETGRVVAAPTHFEVPELRHQHAGGPGAWLFLAAVMAVLLVAQWERFSSFGLGGTIIAAATACPLLAASWENEVAVASALRWYSAAFLLIASAGVWLRAPLARIAERLGWGIDRSVRSVDQTDADVTDVALSGPHRGPYTALALFLGIAPLAGMVAFVASAALAKYPIDSGGAELLRTLAIVFAVGTLIAGALWSVAAGWIGEIGSQSIARSWTKHAGTLVLILGFAPLLALVLYVMSAALRGNPVTGPEPGTFFQRIGLAASYALPIALMAMTLVGYAVRERSARFAFAAGLLFNVSATAGYLLVGGKAGLSLDLWIKLGQLNAIVTGGYALAWALATCFAPVGRILNPSDPSLGRGLDKSQGRGLLATYTLLGVAFNVILIVPGLWALFVDAAPSPQHATLGGPLGWGALLVAASSLAALVFNAGLRMPAGTVCAGLLSAGALVTFSLCRYDTGNGLGYHSMLISFAAASWLMLIASWGLSRWLALRRVASANQEASGSSVGFGLRSGPYGYGTRWPAIVGTLTTIIAVREALSFTHPWWAVTAIAAMSLLAAALACWSLRGGFVYVAGALINLATTIAWLHVWRPSRGAIEELIELIDVNVIALALPCVAWVVLEILRIRPGWKALWARGDAAATTPSPAWPSARSPGFVGIRAVGFHRVAAVIAIVACVAVVAVGLSADAARESLTPSIALGWLALVSATLGTAACLWDERAKAPVLGLYVLGLAAVGMTLDLFNLEPRMIAWMGTVVLAAYTIATSYLWSRRAGLLAWARLLRMPGGGRIGDPSDSGLGQTFLSAAQPPDGRIGNPSYAGLWWLIPATGLLITVVLVSTYAIVLTFAEQSLRLLVGKAAVLQTVAVALLAQGQRRSLLQRVALCVGVIGAVAWGWAWLDPASAADPAASGNLVNRTVVVTVVLGAMTALYGLGLAKLIRRENEWTRAAQQLVPHLGVLGIVSVLVVLGIEAADYFGAGHVPMSAAAIAAVAATLIGLTVAALLTALVPGRDPFDLSERGRTIYVYAAEGLLALLFLHTRLTMPWLFTGFFSRYWAFIVVFIAFLGVGLSEIFRRQKRLVLAEPLERTGALLPMLPVLGFFLIQRTEGDYSILLILVGVLYAGLSVSRRSFGFGLLAALAANGGLWYYLQRLEGFGLLEHPQMWLIPAAVCVLAAAYLNREQLSPQQMTTVRYLTSTTIYVSSTADIFLVGMAQAPWLPLVLAGFSIAGIFAGILLRVRAFLFLGTSFLVLALATIIWHAAVDLRQTWLLWVAVVAAGVLILALFALFEKKRHEVLEVIDKLKHWEA